MSAYKQIQETGMIHDGEGDDYAKILNGILRWFHKKTNALCKDPVSLQDISFVNWLPYHEVKEITPKAGELWITPNGEKFFAVKVSLPAICGTQYEILLVGENGIQHDIDYFKKDWILLCCSVADDSVERIEINNGSYLHEIIKREPYSKTEGYWNNILGYFRELNIKMILEIPKE